MAESQDLEPRKLGLAALGIAVTVVFVLILLAIVLARFTWTPVTTNQPLRPPQQPPEPRVQPNPIKLRIASQQIEDEVLNGYGWVDRDGGVARIPIERAIEILAAREKEGTQ